MTKHGKNATASACYSYHEKQRDKKEGNYGDQKVRLGKDSIKEFDCCSLTLQPCRNPVITPDGVLYDKQAILENILHQKREIAKKLKEFERQKNKDGKELQDLARAEKQSQAEKFAREHKDISAKPAASSGGAGSSVSNMSGDKADALPSFWIPSLTPKADKARVEKPDTKVRCLETNKPLKLKDLLPVDFTLIKDGDTKTSLIAKKARYQCAVTGDALGNSVPCAVLKTSGKVVTMECVEKLIKKDAEWRDPTNGKTLTDKDIIILSRGASGFSAAGTQLMAVKAGAAQMAY